MVVLILGDADEAWAPRSGSRLYVHKLSHEKATVQLRPLGCNEEKYFHCLFQPIRFHQERLSVQHDSSSFFERIPGLAHSTSTTLELVLCLPDHTLSSMRAGFPKFPIFVPAQNGRKKAPIRHEWRTWSSMEGSSRK